MLIKIEKYTKQELQKLITESTSISELLRKMGYPGHGIYHIEMTKFLKESNFDTSTLVGRHIKRYDDKGIPKKPLSEVLCKNSTGNSNKLKERLIKYGVKKYQCENPECGIKEWLNKPIKLQLHHINGNHYDNRLENLVLLCPNCHSQTSNFGSKNSADVLNKILSKVAIDESKTALENLLKFEEERKKEIIENRIRLYGSPEKRDRTIKKESKQKIILYCKNCGKIITRKGKTFCSIDCSTEYQRKERPYTNEDIIEASKKCSSVTELSKIFNITCSAIKKRLRKINKFEEVKKNLDTNKKDYTILQYDLNNNFIKEWKNAEEASNYLKISKTHIYSCCRNKQKTCGNFIWKFKNI